MTVQNAIATRKDGDKEEPAEKILFDLSKSIICIEEVSDKGAADRAEGSAESSAASETTFDSSKSVDMVLLHFSVAFSVLLKTGLHLEKCPITRFNGFLACRGRANAN